MKKMLLVANVAKEHVIKFHLPSIKAFSDHGWIVDVACSGTEHIPYCHEQIKLCYERASIDLKLVKGICDLKRIIDNGQYDLVYCHTTIGGVAGRLASRKARKTGTKVIYFSHGFFFYKGGPAVYWPTFYMTEKVLSYITDAIITINQEDYEIVKKHFSKCKVYRINGIGYDRSKLNLITSKEQRELTRSQWGIPDGATVLIYLAELHKNKNQVFLLRVLQRLLSEGEDVYLVLAGYDHADGQYQAFARELQIENFVRFLGWQDNIGRLLAAADICTASSIREGFGLNLVEAMACGLPVVATKNRGHSTIVQDGVNGFLVDQNDIDTFSHRIRELIHNRSLQEKLSKEGLKSCEQYSSEAATEKLLKILEETVSQNN